MTKDKHSLQQLLRKSLAIVNKGIAPEKVKDGVTTENCHRVLSDMNLIEAALLVEAYLGINDVAGNVNLFGLLSEYLLDLEARTAINKIIGQSYLGNGGGCDGE